MILDEWAREEGISPAAIERLRARLGVHTDPTGINSGRSESNVQTRVRFEASANNARLWRNNVGACETSTGSWIRFGLCNDTPKLNEEIKSSDLIGIRKILIQPWMVGTHIGQFVARECKHEGWVFSGDEHEIAQLRYLELVLSFGGDACFATDTGTI